MFVVVQRAVCSSCPRDRVWVGAVAQPQVTMGRHWFEVKINSGRTSYLMIGWSSPEVALGSRGYNDERGCVWWVSHIFLWSQLNYDFCYYCTFSWLKRLWSRRKCCRKTKVESNDEAEFQMTSFLRREYKKPKLGDMTLAEYTEKVIIYGYLMVSFVLKCIIDMSVSKFKKHWALDAILLYFEIL